MQAQQENSTDIASKFFDAKEAFSRLEDDLFDRLVVLCGGVGNEPETWPFDDVTTDGYDTSVELKDTRDDFIVTEEIKAGILALGFSRFWVCYKNGSESYNGGPRKQRGEAVKSA